MAVTGEGAAATGRPERGRLAAGSKDALIATWLCVLAACPGKGNSTPRRDAGDAGTVTGAGGSGTGTGTGTAPDGVAAPYVLAATDADGGVGGASLTVKVLWPTATAAVRASPGYTACHTPRRARARVGTLHGVAGAMVVLDVGAGKAPPPVAAIRVTVRDCASTPAALAAPRLGSTLEIQSQDVAHEVFVERTGKPWLEDDILLAPVTLARTHLPVIGHTVAVPLDEAGAIRVVTDGAADDATWVLAPPHPYAGVTDDEGAILLRDVPAGTFTIVAWLPPAGGQPAQRATASVTIAAGADADASVTFTP